MSNDYTFAMELDLPDGDQLLFYSNVDELCIIQRNPDAPKQVDQLVIPMSKLEGFVKVICNILGLHNHLNQEVLNLLDDPVVDEEKLIKFPSVSKESAEDVAKFVNRFFKDGGLNG